MRRAGGNLAEVQFWKLVRAKGFHGLRFKRQKIIGNYIVDFYCPFLGLVVEIDGGIHDYCLTYDRKREHYLKSLGCKIIRFSDFLVLNAINQVTQELETFITEQYELPRPSGTPSK